MARKIKLPLDMGNDIKVRDIDELKENYNSEKVVESFLNGELLPWLQDRFYEEEAERVEALSADKDSGNIAGRLAEIFGVQIENEVDVDEIAERNERLAELRSITSDDEVLRNVDLVAFSQEDMDIVHESDVIYLCGDKFRIPYNVKNKRYIGVNEPLVEIKTDGNIDLESRGIVIEKCRFAEEMLSKVSKKIEPYKIVEDGLAYLKKRDFQNANSCFKKAAEYGDHEGEFQYGKSFDLGRGVKKDIKLARHWYLKAAQDGSAKACNNLGKIYEKEGNYSKALKMYKNGLEFEERPTLLYNLGHAYLNDDFGEKNPKEAEKLLLKAAEQGFGLACTELSYFYINEEYNFFDISKSEYWINKGIDDAGPFEFEWLANKFLDDTCSGYSVKKALKYYELAIDKIGYDKEDIDLNVKRTVCLYRLGNIDESKAVRIFRENAESDMPESFAVEELIKYYEKKNDRDMVNKLYRIYAEECIGDKKSRYLFIAAENYVNEGRYDEAEGIYMGAIAFMNSNAEDLICAYDKTGDIHMYHMRGCQSAQECRDQAKPFYKLALEICKEHGIDKNDSRYIDIESKLVDASRKW